MGGARPRVEIKERLVPGQYKGGSAKKQELIQLTGDIHRTSRGEISGDSSLSGDGQSRRRRERQTRAGEASVNGRGGDERRASYVAVRANGLETVERR